MILMLFRGILLSAVVGTVVSILYFESFLRSIIEKYGKLYMGVPVTVDHIRTSLSQGMVILHGLTIKNPEGFHSEYLLRIDKLIIQVQLQTLMKSPIIISLVEIRQPHVIYERVLLNDANWDVVVKSLLVGSGPTTAPASSSTASSNEVATPVTKYILERVLIVEGSTQVALLGGQNNSMTLPLLPVDLKNIGKDQGGVSMAGLLGALLQAILTSTLEALGPMVSPVLNQAATAVENVAATLGAVSEVVTASTQAYQELSTIATSTVNDLKTIFGAFKKPA